MPNPGSAGLEFKEGPVLFSELRTLAGLEFEESKGSNLGSTDSELLLLLLLTMFSEAKHISGKGQGRTLVRQVWSLEKDRFLCRTLYSCRFGVWRKDWAESWFGRFGVWRKASSFL